ncbi:O-antigen ligase family protein [Aliikangiella sp. IMCC44359]|uniref:O-antigen ligase family protein n=1 Tax=Aliikangiella sp. IMCC44359 TaxID=3459125 RepID=UPI00403AD318
MSFFVKVLAIIIIYIPNQLHFPQSLGLPGLNVLNVLVIFAIILYKKQNYPTSEPDNLKGLFYFYFIMLVSAFIISQLHMKLDLMADFTNLKTLIFYPCIYFVYFYAVRTYDDASKLYLVVLFVAFVAGLEAIREAIDYGIGNYHESKRASGPFGENFYSANRAGVFYAMFLPFFLSIIFFWKGNKWVKYVGIAGSVVLVAAIFFTYSRQSYFIAMLAIAYMIFKRRGWVSVLTIIALSLGPLWVPESAMQRIEGTEQVSDTGEEKYDESTESRMIIWAGAMDMVAEYPLGVGLNRFKLEIGNFSIYPGKDAHNFYVLNFAEGNFIGLLALLLLIFGLWRLGRRVINLDDSPTTKMVGHGYTCSVICMSLGNVYGSPFASGEVMGTFWVMTALTARYYWLQTKRLAQDEQSDVLGEEEAIIEKKHPVFG